MNQLHLEILNDPNDGFTEVCDVCFSILRNWNSVGDIAFVTFENRIACEKCYELDNRDRQNSN